MQRPRTLGPLLGPLVVLLAVAGPALAQEPAAAEKRASAPVSETRELEAEIEQYPGPEDGVTMESDTRIPGVPLPQPEKPSVNTWPSTAADPKSPRGPSVSIDPKEIQRVFGQDALVLDLNTLNSAQVTRLQTRLRERGHYLGVIDGVMGPKTRAALAAVVADQFALSQRLLQQNQLTTELAAQVGLQSAARAPRPAPRGAPPLSPPTPLPPSLP